MKPMDQDHPSPYILTKECYKLEDYLQSLIFKATNNHVCKANCCETEGLEVVKEAKGNKQ